MVNARTEREAMVYWQLEALQGIHVPPVPRDRRLGIFWLFVYFSSSGRDAAQVPMEHRTC